MISVLILTKNEEGNLPACLASVKWCDDIVVLDQGSTDGTVELARAAGARVVINDGKDEWEQRTFSVRSISFRHPWVYNPDADEVASCDLVDEMIGVVQGPGRSEVAYRSRFKTIFLGRWIRHASLYPTWVVRLFRPERLSFRRTTNLEYVVEGPVGRLQAHFDHYSFGNGLNAWFEKHNRYSSHEASETIRQRHGGTLDVVGLAAAGDPVRRRRALKELSFRLPCRPSLRFFYMYVFRGGFLDGIPGWTYCRLLAAYERMIVWKVRELERREREISR